MSENRVKGDTQNLAGQVQDAVGSMAGNTRAQVEGTARQVAGKVQSAYGEAADRGRDVAASVGRGIEQQPLSALLIAGVVGYVLAWLIHRRW